MAKRTKKSNHKPSPEEYDSSEYEIKAIVGERDGEYEVQWTNTWLPKSDCNHAAVAAWKARQLEIRTARLGSSSPLSSAASVAAPELHDSNTTSDERPAFQPRPQDAVISSTTNPPSGDAAQPVSSEPAIQDSFPDSPVVLPVVNSVEEVATLAGVATPTSVTASKQQALLKMTSIPAVPPHVMEEIATSQPGTPAGLRSPSVIPAHYRSPIATQAEQNTSERYSTLFPEETYALQHERTDQERSPAEVEGQHLLGVPLLGHQRDQYQTTPSLKYHGLIKAILDGDDDGTEEELASAEDLIERLRAIAMHPDLDNLEALTQYDVDHDQEATWSTQASSKFRFLGFLIDSTHLTTSHIAIAASGGKLLRILDIFLKGMTISHSQATATYSVIRDEEPVTADLVIDLDGSYTDNARSLDGSPALWITLISKYTIEHIERSLPEDVTPTERVRMTLDAFREYAQDTGSAKETSTTLKEYAAALAAFLAQRSDVWPLPELAPVDMSFTMGEASSDSTNIKRARSSSGSERSVKRARFDIPLREEKTDPDQTQKLLGTLQATYARYNQLETSFGTVITDLEDTRTKLHATTRERDAAQKTVTAFQERLAANTKRVSDLRTKISELEGQLDEANNGLANHVIPQRAELESQRLLAVQAEQKVQKIQGRLDEAKRQQEYAQGLYQQASSQAATLAGENTTLQEELAKAQKAASGERVRLRELSNDIANRKLLDDNRKLEAMLQSYARTIRTKDEEITRLKDGRGRIGTRGSSVPRSPRMSSPMKHMDRSRAVSPSGDRAKLHPLRNGQGP